MSSKITDPVVTAWRGRRCQRGEHGLGLAGTGLPDNRRRLAAPEREAHPLDDSCRTVTHAKIAHLEERLARKSSITASPAAPCVAKTL